MFPLQFKIINNYNPASIKSELHHLYLCYQENYKVLYSLWMQHGPGTTPTDCEPLAATKYVLKLMCASTR